MSLTDTAIRGAKPRDKVFTLGDGDGLSLEVHPAGGKYWRLRYWIAKKEYRLSLGVYPEISLREARTRRDEAKRQIATTGEIVRENASDTFQSVAMDWFNKKMLGVKADGYTKTVIARMKRLLFPPLGKMQVVQITPQEILSVLTAIENRGTIDLAHRVLQIASQVFRYAVACGKTPSDPTRDLRGALRPPVGRHFSSITAPDDVAKLMREIYTFNGSIVVKSAMRVVAHTFVRSGELRHAEWSEIDLDAREWRIPAEKMKMRRVHIVPLSSQVVATLRDLKMFTGHGRYVFPSIRALDGNVPMSENTILAALRRMGYTKEEMTGHGFRSMASTRLNESGLWSSDVIELQLAHAERNKIRAAYNYAEHLDKRREMLQWWSDYLDGLARGGI